MSRRRVDIRDGADHDAAGDRDDDARGQETNFEVTRTWDDLEEIDGNLAVTGVSEAEKRKRLLKDTTPLQRGIIRHLMLIIDMSDAMAEKDLRPTRYQVTLNYTVAFVREYFEQNPISQLGIIAMRNGVAEPISDMSGNPTEHIKAISRQKAAEPHGQPSLENALELARAALFHAPSHGTREILLVMGALHSVDPGDVHRTIDALVADKIHASVIGLAAQMAICRQLVSKTNNGETSGYNIITHEGHLRELMMAVTTPPATLEQAKSASSLLMMGFPSRTVDSQPSLCACHSRPSREGYLCSRCGTKVCGLPSECPACSLTLILSTHLARSYHHLFPLVNWVEVPWSRASRSQECFACQRPFPEVPPREQWLDKDSREMNSSRYECTTCHSHFCIECDLFAHEVVHNCPGCQSGGATAGLMGEVELEDGHINGNDRQSMEVDS
ncbi:hypothetical protein OHC33_005466 [Knufia fluminis]|uniref:General transcription and DNA repair factor IIH n=1 Tax=Knufia fluminis TaxID=191047 RepID=A0AAN8I427_9EURO|nr:hypothetical protein OHC33_005466 [Knufia fluminis]